MNGLSEMLGATAADLAAPTAGDNFKQGRPHAPIVPSTPIASTTWLRMDHAMAISAKDGEVLHACSRAGCERIERQQMMHFNEPATMFAVLVVEVETACFARSRPVSRRTASRFFLTSSRLRSRTRCIRVSRRPSSASDSFVFLARRDRGPIFSGGTNCGCNQFQLINSGRRILPKSPNSVAPAKDRVFLERL